MAIESLEMATTSQIKSEVLTPLFRGNGVIAFYADQSSPSPERAKAYADYVSALCMAPVSKLAAIFTEIVGSLEDADPAKISAVQALPGASPVDVLEVKIKYQRGCQNFDGRYEALQRQVGCVRSMTFLCEPIIREHKARIAHIDLHVLAGQEFLAGCAITACAEASAPFRLNVRLQDLSEKAAMLRNSVLHMGLSLARAQEILDQFDSLPEGMASKWMSYRQTPIAGHQVAPEDLEKAASAHRTLLDSFTRLSERAQNAGEQERAAAIALAHEIVLENDLVEGDLFRVPSGRRELRREPRSARYFDPVSGFGWTSKDQTPAWLTGEDLRRYLIA